MTIEKRFYTVGYRTPESNGIDAGVISVKN